MPKFSSFKGFTLIELMVAISIVAILATIGMVMFSSAQATARDAKRKGDLEDFKKALYLYKTATGSFCPGSALTNCTWTAPATGANGFEGTAANDLESTIEPYLKSALHDPKWPTGGEDYYLSATYDNFVLSAKLENVPSPAMTCASGSTSGPASGRNYCITN